MFFEKVELGMRGGGVGGWGEGVDEHACKYKYRIFVTKFALGDGGGGGGIDIDCINQ